MVYDYPTRGCEVEFCDPSGGTLAVLTLYDDDLEKLTETRKTL